MQEDRLASVARLLAGYHAVRGTASVLAASEFGTLCAIAAVAALDKSDQAKEFGTACAVLSNPASIARQQAAAFEKAAAAVEALQDAGRASRAILGQKAALLAVAKGCVGSHTAKIPDNRLPDGAILADAAVLASAQTALRGVATGNYVAQRPVSGSGNAAWNRAMRFLTWPVSIDGGEVTWVAVLLADAASPLRDAFLAPLEVEAREVLLAAGAAFAAFRGGQEALPSRVDARQKSILWLLPDGGYAVISPLPSFAMMAELERRLGERSRRPEANADDALWQRFSTTPIGVGGTKPQNTALIAGDAAGIFRRLVSLPPNSQRRGPAELLRRLGGSTIQFSGRDIRKATLDFLLDCLNDRRDNKAKRDRRDAAEQQLAEDVLAPLRALCELASTNPSAEPKVHPSNRALAAVAGFKGYDLDPSDIGDMADQAARAILGRLEGLKYGPKGARQQFMPVDANLETFREHCEAIVKEHAA